MEQKGKFYLCCASSKKAYYKKKILLKHRPSIFLTELLDDADGLLVIGKPDEKMQMEMQRAKRLGKGVKTLSESEIKELEKNSLLKERRFSSQNRGREYEL